MSIPSTKFSHPTPQPMSVEKSNECSVKEGNSHLSVTDDVTLISNNDENCGVEKIKTMTDAMQVCLRDIATLAKTPLRRRYPREANAHRNMLSRRGKVGAIVHPAFAKFDSFLRHIGPIPANKATLDRINNDDPEYAPSKVRWADKRTQNSNKGDSLVFYCARTGDEYTSSRLAKLQGVSPNTIRTRYHRGWSDNEIIEGKRHKTEARAPESEATTFNSRAKSRAVQQSVSAADTYAYRLAKYCRHSREVDGVEYFIATPAEIAEILDDSPASPEKDLQVRENMRKFMAGKLPRWWKEYKPYILFHKLEPHQQDMIRQIDPDYVATLEDSSLSERL